jgi:hypothetical protein
MFLDFSDIPLSSSDYSNIAGKDNRDIIIGGTNEMTPTEVPTSGTNIKKTLFFETYKWVI